MARQEKGRICLPDVNGVSGEDDCREYQQSEFGVAADWGMACQRSVKPCLESAGSNRAIDGKKACLAHILRSISRLE